MKARSALPPAWVRTLLGFGLLGLVLGFVTGARLMAVNPSLRPGDAWVIALNVGAVYALVGALAGLGLAALGLLVRVRPGQRDAPFRGALIAGIGAAIVGFAGLSLAGSPRGILLVGVLAAAVAIALHAWGRRRPVLGSWILAGFSVAWLAVGYSVVDAASGGGPPAEYVPFQATYTAPEAPVLLVGIDGADWKRIDALVAEGRLPAIARLVSRGVRAPLATTMPTWSPILWTTISTGTLAAQHGVLDFAETPLPGLECGVQRLRKTPLLPACSGLGTLTSLLYETGLLAEQPISARHRRVKALWNVVSDVGGRVAVVNWFASWPCEPLNGVMVSDRNPKRAAFLLERHGLEENVTWGVTYPPDLLAKLVDVAAPEVGSEPSDVLDLPIFAEISPAQRAALAEDAVLAVFRQIYESDGLALAATRELLRSQPIDFAAVYTSGVDNISHRFHQTGVVDHYYEYVDRQLAEVIAAAGPGASIAVVSDHGFEYEDEQHLAHEHGPDGILLLSGPAFRSGVCLEERPSIADVAPTLLALLGLPVAESLDGRPVLAAFEPGWLAAHPVTSVASYGAYAPPLDSGGAPAPAALQDEVMEKLRALGYVAE